MEEATGPTFSNLLMRTQSTAALSSGDISSKWLERCICIILVVLTLLLNALC